MVMMVISIIAHDFVLWPKRRRSYVYSYEKNAAEVWKAPFPDLAQGELGNCAPPSGILLSAPPPVLFASSSVHDAALSPSGIRPLLTYYLYRCPGRPCLPTQPRASFVTVPSPPVFHSQPSASG